MKLGDLQVRNGSGVGGSLETAEKAGSALVPDAQTGAGEDQE